MHALKAKIKDAEKIRKELLTLGILAHGYKIKKDKTSLYFPLSSVPENYPTLELDFEKTNTEHSFKKTLQNSLPAEDLEKIKTAMDIVGSIAILEIDPTLHKHALLIAETLLKTNKTIKTVVRKQGEHSGIFRTQDYEYLAGEQTFETIHRENKVQFFLDIRKTYFSPRLSTERLRISKLIKKGEKVLVLFSGIGAYPLVFSKNSPAKEIYGVELNPDACLYAEKNILLNKTHNVFLYCGDAREVSSHLEKTFDRILLPLPHGAENFLPLLPSLSKKGTVIHLYSVSKEEDFSSVRSKLISFFPQAKVQTLIKCGMIKVRTFRICIDFTL